MMSEVISFGGSHVGRYESEEDGKKIWLCSECCGVCSGWCNLALGQREDKLPKEFSYIGFKNMSPLEKQRWFAGVYARSKELRDLGYSTQIAYYHQYEYARSDVGKARRKEWSKSDAGRESRMRAQKKYREKKRKAFGSSDTLNTEKHLVSLRKRNKEERLRGKGGILAGVQKPCKQKTLK